MSVRRTRASLPIAVRRRRQVSLIDNPNPILVDDRAGSRDLLPHLPAKYRKLTRMDYGDVAFTGNGPRGTLDIGYELKSIPDLVACIHDGRYAGHQLPGMQREFDLSYLLILDRVKCDHIGTLLYHKGFGKWRQPFSGQRYALTLTSLRKWLLTVEVQGGVRVIFCDGLTDAAHMIMSHYKWWDHLWDEHKSLKTFDDSRTFSAFSEPSTLRKMAAQFKTISWTRSRAVEAHFDSIRDMANADETEWQEIEGIGPKIARAAVAECGRIVGHRATVKMAKTTKVTRAKRKK